eukprot:1173883-Prorocentrum_minimum.AAC.2
MRPTTGGCKGHSVAPIRNPLVVNLPPRVVGTPVRALVIYATERPHDPPFRRVRCIGTASAPQSLPPIHP